jgi:hypothetical protein
MSPEPKFCVVAELFGEVRRSLDVVLWFVSFEAAVGHPVLQPERIHVALWNNTTIARSNIVRRHANLFHKFEEGAYEA